MSLTSSWNVAPHSALTLSLSNNLKASWTSESILAESFLDGTQWLDFRLCEQKLVFLLPHFSAETSPLTDNILLSFVRVALPLCAFSCSVLSLFLFEQLTRRGDDGLCSNRIGGNPTYLLKGKENWSSNERFCCARSFCCFCLQPTAGGLGNYLRCSYCCSGQFINLLNVAQGCTFRLHSWFKSGRSPGLILFWK